MIEVIKPGVLYEDRSFEIRCRLCRALLRFKGADVTRGADVHWIVCPQCDTNTMVGPGNNITGLKDVTVEPAPA
jgi:hypothetical protein